MNLVQLEWKKVNKRPYLTAAFCLAAFSLFVALLFLFLPESERGLDIMGVASEWQSLILLVSCLTLCSFTVLGAVLGESVILESYLGKKVLLLFSYPIKRATFLRAKTVVMAGFTAVGALAANICAVLAASVFSAVFRSELGMLSFTDVRYLAVESVLIAVLAPGICMASLRIGFWKKSRMAVIVSALIIMAPLTNLASINLFGEAGLAAFAAGAAVMFFLVYGNLKTKIECMEVM